MLTKDFPDHHDADLIIKLYELRREPVMREARSAVNGKFWPRSFDDVLAIAKTDHPLNASFRQTSTYWEMVYGMAKHGVIHADFMMESCSEGMYILAKMEPYLELYRAQVNPTAFRNAEWVATHSETARAALERFRHRVQTTLSSKS
ncbi:MAG: DUF4760 domain-containing protein [Gemmatimonadaceae bacterium]